MHATRDISWVDFWSPLVRPPPPFIERGRAAPTRGYGGPLNLELLSPLFFQTRQVQRGWV